MKHGWQIKRLGDLLEIQNGFAFSSKDYSESGHFIMRIGNVQNGYVTLSNPKFIKMPSGGSLERFELSEGDILVSLTGNVGRVGVIQKDHLPAALNQRVAKISIRKDSPASREFILFIIFSDWFKEELKAAGHGAAQQNVSTKDIAEISIPLPPLPEQQRIVAILDEAFAGIEAAAANTQKNLANARELFESYLNTVFTQKGDGWVEKTLGDVCKMIKRGVAPKYIDIGGICVINQKCIRDHVISTNFTRRHDLAAKSVNPERYIQLGDVLVNSTGTGTLGRVAQVREEPNEPTTVDTHVTIVRPQPGKYFNDFFGYMLVRIEDEIAFSGEGTSGQTELSRSTLSDKFKVSFPSSIHEQKRIVEGLDFLSTKTKKLEVLYQKKLANFDELKQSILQKAFAGELTAQLPGQEDLA